MSKVITFSRYFPSYHPRRGESTYFVEKLYKSILKPTDHVPITGIESGLSLFALANAQPKHHTIRAGHRWKVGDWFSPRVWSGKPYNSKMVTIAPDIQIKKIWRFEIKNKEIRIWGSERSLCGLYDVPANEVPFIAQNDGLSFTDFMHWFSWPKDFDGQIISWNENIKY